FVPAIHPRDLPSFPTRRSSDLLTGLASLGCGLASPAFAQAPQRRREVVVSGKRVRTVDLHAHCHVPEANALMGLKVQLQSLVVRSEEHTSELQSPCNLVCRLLL